MNKVDTTTKKDIHLLNNIKLIVAFGALIFIVALIISLFLFTDPKIKESYSLLGNGTKEDPYQINIEEDLVRFRELVNSGISFSGEYVIQNVDLDLRDVEAWIPIGRFRSGNYFYGTYDGDGHVIKNLTCTDSNAGLFGYLCGEVRNLGIESGNIDGTCIGGLTSHGSSSAVIFNCYNKASVHGSSRAGGIADNFGGKILYCWNLGNVTCDTGVFGGIASYASQELVKCYSVDIPIVSSIFVGDIYDSNVITIEEINDDFMYDLNESIWQYLNDGESFVSERDFTIHYINASKNSGVCFDENGVPESIVRKERKSFFTAYGVIIFLLAVSILFLFVLFLKREKYFGNSVAREKTSIESEVMTFEKFSFLGLGLFLVFVILGWGIANNTLTLKRSDGVTTMQDYYEQPAGTVDVLMLGSSRSGINFDCEELWKEYGISSYMLWGSFQPMWNTYYYLKEAIKVNRPKVVVLETNTGIYSFEYSDDERQYVNTYGMKMSSNKVEAVQASAPQERWADLLLGLPIYHTRYTELTETDFRRYPWNISKHVSKGGSVRYGSGTLTDYGDAADLVTIKEVNFKEELYLRKIIELCQSENLPLLLIEGPVTDRTNLQPYFNYIKTIADEYSLPYLNYNLLDADTGLNISDIYVDNAHLNTNGGRKVSSHLGKYLMDNYELQDHRGDKAYQSWEDFAHRMENQYYPMITNTDDYLKELVRNERTAVFLKWKVSDGNAYLETFLQQAKAYGLNLDFCREAGDGCWVMQNTQDSTQVQQYDIPYNSLDKCMFNVEDEEVKIERTQGGTVSFGEKSLSPIPAGIICMIYDTYTGELIDTCLLFGTEAPIHY